MPTTFLFFSFTLLFSLFCFLIFISRIIRLWWCNCHICKSYLTKSWSTEFTNLCDWYTHLLRNSPTGTINVHVLGNIITSNSKNVEHIAKTRFDNYPKGRPFSTILGDLLGRGIFNVDGRAWVYQRKMASLELGSVTIRSYALEIVHEEMLTRLLPVMASAACVKDYALDLQDIFRRFTFDTVCKFSFGIDPHCLIPSLPVSELAVAFDTASRISAERALTPSPFAWKIKRLLNIGSEKELKEAINVINSIAQEIINNRREDGFSTRNDLLSRFMSSFENDDRFLRDIVTSFLLAGRDSIASALTGFFLLLSKHPRVEALIREELDRVIDNPVHECASFQQLNRMHYLNAAVHEGMRLFPPVQFDSKFAHEDDVLPDGTFIPKGTRVTYHQYAMGRMEQYWGPDCLEFKPERWLREGVFVPVDQFKYPVFHAGPRICLGKELALMETKYVVIALVKQFDIRMTGDISEPRLGPGLTANLQGGLPVQVYARQPMWSR